MRVNQPRPLPRVLRQPGNRGRQRRHDVCALRKCAKATTWNPTPRRRLPPLLRRRHGGEDGRRRPVMHKRLCPSARDGPWKTKPRHRPLRLREGLFEGCATCGFVPRCRARPSDGASSEWSSFQHRLSSQKESIAMSTKRNAAAPCRPATPNASGGRSMPACRSVSGSTRWTRPTATLFSLHYRLSTSLLEPPHRNVDRCVVAPARGLALAAVGAGGRPWLLHGNAASRPTRRRRRICRYDLARKRQAARVTIPLRSDAAHAWCMGL